MTDQEMRIAIEEACGLKVFVLHKLYHDPFGYYRENANGYTNDIEKAWHVTAEVAAKYVNSRKDQPDRVIAEHAPTPDYPNDLNAMHEAINSLPEELQFRFTEKLESVIKPLCGKPWTWIWLCATATARQRAEAFLRTIGKWKEGGV